eukprot:CAMPEP_0184480980 /NCGR_PEP_ID=MMETSP0113_2-20130426/2520_1 /TAXON_ID=91329 /ORGANISM="Norrisiella sphaerica, Strain BC52" /LENGTH=496 /DNA_ID=CAMNT_0026859831 /DNA_START=250 /DNA_END=1740 /DNA_ORIENTATION=+
MEFKKPEEKAGHSPSVSSRKSEHKTSPQSRKTRVASSSQGSSNTKRLVKSDSSKKSDGDPKFRGERGTRSPDISINRAPIDMLGLPELLNKHRAVAPHEQGPSDQGSSRALRSIKASPVVRKMIDGKNDAEMGRAQRMESKGKVRRHGKAEGGPRGITPERTANREQSGESEKEKKEGNDDEGPKTQQELHAMEGLSTYDKMKCITRYYLEHSDSKLGIAIDIFLLLINLLACVLFVVEIEGGKSIYALDTTIGLIFIMEYILRLWVACNRWKYILSWYGIIDLTSCIPTIIDLFVQQSYNGISALQVFRVLRVLRFARFLETEHFFFGKITKNKLQTLRILFTVMAILFCAAGSFTAVEGPHTNVQTVTGFGEAVYFTIITFSTVGYGDITPETTSGRALVSIFILCTMIFVPSQVHELVRLNAEMERQKDINAVTCRRCGLIGHDHDASHCKRCGHVIREEATNSQSTLSRRNSSRSGSRSMTRSHRRAKSHGV